MPSDAYMDTIENIPVAARALFWARLGNWPFARWRSMSDDAVRAELDAGWAERDARVGGAGAGICAVHADVCRACGRCACCRV